MKKIIKKLNTCNNLYNKSFLFELEVLLFLARKLFEGYSAGETRKSISLSLGYNYNDKMRRKLSATSKLLSTESNPKISISNECLNPKCKKEFTKIPQYCPYCNVQVLNPGVYKNGDAPKEWWKINEAGIELLIQVFNLHFKIYMKWQDWVKKTTTNFNNLPDVIKELLYNQDFSKKNLGDKIVRKETHKRY